MLYVDLPSKSEFLHLHKLRADACLSIYLPTTAISQDAEAGRTELANQFKDARGQLEAVGFDKRRLADLADQIDDLRDDDEFWRLQANSLAVLATPDRIRTFRLANGLTAATMVSDRFHLTPLMRALTFQNAAFVLSLSESAARLVEVFPDLPPADVNLSDLPKDAASAVRKSSLNDRAPSGRIQGSEGQNVRLRQYARQVDAALRRTLTGRETPLILAAADRMASIYRSVNHYPHLVEENLAHTTDRTTNDELATAARAILDGINAREVKDLNERFAERRSRGLATSDLSDAARAATFGAVDTLMVDFEADIPGLIDDTTGAVSFDSEASATTYDVVNEVAARALDHGGRVLSVRAADLPDDAPVAAILRYAV